MSRRSLAALASLVAGVGSLGASPASALLIGDFEAGSFDLTSTLAAAGALAAVALATAIGVAASHGDLSENSGWDAAVEEQRNLTDRARVMDDELQLARLIGDQVIPDDMVSPGTRVTFHTDDEERTVRLLGPWDTTSDDILNYKAPLGQALLGMKPGQASTIELGGNEHELRVDAVEKL